MVERLEANGPRKLVISGEEAHHALRVKRLAEGDQVELLDGMGNRGTAHIQATRKTGKHGWEMDLEVARVEVEMRAVPRLEVYASAAKGDGLEEMIDGLSQVGADVFRPLVTRRSVVEPREGKLDRMRRVAAESMKQCGRAWCLEVGDSIELEEALREEFVGSATKSVVVVADASGSGLGDLGLKGAERVVLLVGPEGGWSEAERQKFAAMRIRIFRCAVNVLRVETAAVVAAAMIRMGG